MKYKILLLFLWCSSALFAQNKSSNQFPNQQDNRHELKFNTTLALLSIPEISYEYFLDKKSSIGLSVGYTVDQSHIDLDFYLLPYYRRYFGKKKNSTGFFLESNFMYFSESTFYNDFRNQQEGFGIGAAVGYKLLKSNGLTVDFTFGLVRNLTVEDPISSGFPRLGISIGKRLSTILGEKIKQNKQRQSIDIIRNEIKVNIPQSIYGVPELSYERILTKHSSVGLSVAYSVTKKTREQYFLLPHYRFYFGEQPASGFFIELGAMFWQTKNTWFSSKKKGFGGEMALGLKVRKIPNFPIELVVGFGRSYINNDILWERFIPRLGLSIGRQF